MVGGGLPSLAPCVREGLWAILVAEAVAPACSCCVGLPLGVWWRWGPARACPPGPPALAHVPLGVCASLCGWLAPCGRAGGALLSLGLRVGWAGAGCLRWLSLCVWVGAPLSLVILCVCLPLGVCGGWRPGFARAPCAPRPPGNPGGVGPCRLVLFLSLCLERRLSQSWGAGAGSLGLAFLRGALALACLPLGNRVSVRVCGVSGPPFACAKA